MAVNFASTNFDTAESMNGSFEDGRSVSERAVQYPNFHERPFNNGAESARVNISNDAVVAPVPAKIETGFAAVPTTNNSVTFENIQKAFPKVSSLDIASTWNALQYLFSK